MNKPRKVGRPQATPSSVESGLSSGAQFLFYETQHRHTHAKCRLTMLNNREGARYAA